jgi:hypothetical protein
MSIGVVVQAAVSHSRLKSRQESDRELFGANLKAETRAREDALKLLEAKLEAETSARVAADLLADEKIKGWAERLKSVQSEQDRTRDMAERVGRLAQAVENLAERVAEGRERTDERFEEIRAALADGRGR